MEMGQGVWVFQGREDEVDIAGRTRQRLAIGDICLPEGVGHLAGRDGCASIQEDGLDSGFARQIRHLHPLQRPTGNRYLHLPSFCRPTAESESLEQRLSKNGVNLDPLWFGPEIPF
jgi:hypothetical protein